MTENIIIHKDTLIALRCNYGFYLLKAKHDIYQYRISNIKSVNCFESVEIFEGIPPLELPYNRHINFYMKMSYHLNTIQEIKASYKSHNFNDSISAFAFNKRHKQSIEFQKEYLFFIIGGISFQTFKRVPIKHMREFAKILYKK